MRATLTNLSASFVTALPGAPVLCSSPELPSHPGGLCLQLVSSGGYVIICGRRSVTRVSAPVGEDTQTRACGCWEAAQMKFITACFSTPEKFIVFYNAVISLLGTQQWQQMLFAGFSQIGNFEIHK